MMSKKTKGKIKSIACCAAMLTVMGAMAIPSFAGSTTANLTYDAKIAYAGETGFSTNNAIMTGKVSNVSKHTVLVTPKWRAGNIWRNEKCQKYEKSQYDQAINGGYHPNQSVTWTVELEPGGPGYTQCVATATIRN